MNDATRAGQATGGLVVSAGAVIDVGAVIDAASIGRAQVVAVVLGLLLLAIDGYNLYAVGWVLPSLAAHFHVPPSAITSILFLQQVGMIVGTYLIAPVADRVGRRPVLLASTVLLAAASVGASFASTLTMFAACRIVTTALCATLLPNVLALVSETVPGRIRATAVTAALCGLLSAGLLGAAVQAWVLGPFGWQAAFWVGAILPLLVLPACWIGLSESPRFMIVRGAPPARLARLVATLDPRVPTREDATFVLEVGTADAPSAGIARALFGEGRAAQTLLLWACFFCGYAFISFHASWSTTIFKEAGGLAMTRVAVATASYTFWGVLGTIATGLAIDRFGFRATLPAFFLIGAACTVALGWIDMTSGVLIVTLGGLGFFQAGGQAGLGAAAAGFYGTRHRALGVGWAYGAGRFGSLIGPLFGGFALERKMPVALIFGCAALPLIVVVVAFLALSRLQAFRTDAG